MITVRILTVFVILVGCGQCARILGVFHMPAYSHYSLGSRLLTALAEKGHEVTMISPYSEKSPPKNYRDIVLTGIDASGQDKKKEMNMFNMPKLHPALSSIMVISFATEAAEATLNHTNVQKFLKSDAQFDVVIVEQFINEAFRGFAHHYKAPFIVFSTIGPNSWVNPTVGNPLTPSYIVNMFHSYSGPMNFWQRLDNFLTHVFASLQNQFFSYPQQEKMLKKYFPDAPPLSELLYNTSLVLLNSHTSLSQPVPLLPNMIEIGGYHVKPPKKLPKDLQEYLDSAKDGVIFFSMGSNLRCADMPEEQLKVILKVFSRLKQKILWKWEEDNLPGKPSNVKTGKWLPQQDILAHPNIKLFITHGGLLSTTEAVYHGVPVVCIPMFGDQDLNAALSEASGYGRKVSFKNLNEEDFFEAINSILTNTKYTENAKMRSKILHDQQVKPLDKAVFWVEYVIRHRGAPHFRSTALDLTWWQLISLDVLAFLALIDIVVIYTIYLLVKKFICARKQCKKAKDTKKKQN